MLSAAITDLFFNLVFLLFLQQKYMIPDFTSDGLLPEGIHETTWELFCERFGNSSRKRKNLIQKIAVVINILRKVGCQKVYLDGSFVGRMKQPGDFDICWDPVGVDLKLLNEIAPILKYAPNPFRTVTCKKKYGGDILRSNRLQPSPKGEGMLTILSFFQMKKENDEPKGIILLKLDKIDIEL
jgi:hypothetical protein